MDVERIHLGLWFNVPFLACCRLGTGLMLIGHLGFWISVPFLAGYRLRKGSMLIGHIVSSGNESLSWLVVGWDQAGL